MRPLRRTRKGERFGDGHLTFTAKGLVMMDVHWRVYEFDRRTNEWVLVGQYDTFDGAHRSTLIAVGGERVIVPWPVGVGWYVSIGLVGVLAIWFSI